MKHVNVAKRVKEARIDKGYTLEGLATAIGAGKSYIWNIENSKVKAIDGYRLNRIAHVLGTTSEYLLGHCNDDAARLERSYQQYKTLNQKDKDCILSLMDRWAVLANVNACRT